MAVNSFIPAIWSGRVLQPFEKSLVYAQPGVVNRDYEGDITAMGDRVKINSIGEVTINTYSRGTDLSSAQNIDTTGQELIIDQGDYFRFKVNDVDAAQARAEFSSTTLRRAGHKMGDQVDQYVAALMAAAVPTANTLGTVASPKTDLGTTGVFYNYLVDLGVLLDEANVPSEGRWCSIPSWAHGILLKSGSDFIHATPGGDMVLRNGVVGEAAGFMILKSNNVPNTSKAKYKIIAGTDYATSYADQIVETEAYRSHTDFADEVRGLHIYGAKVVYPEALAMLIANKPS